MKKHKTITITESMPLSQALSWWRNIEEVKDLLPAEVSTDPEDNIELAIALVEANAGHRASFLGVPWYFSTLKDAAEMYLRLRYDDNYTSQENEDPYVMAQYLAAGADALLTARGR